MNEKEKSGDFLDREIRDYLAEEAALRRRIEQVREAENERVPRSLIRRAKDLAVQSRVSCPHCGQWITPFKKPVRLQSIRNWVWILLAGASFAASFLWPRHFLQCLALSLFFGVKWAVDRRAAKTQIMIYKALKENVDERLSQGNRVQDFQKYGM